MVTLMLYRMAIKQRAIADIGENDLRSAPTTDAAIVFTREYRRSALWGATCLLVLNAFHKRHNNRTVGAQY